MSLFGAVAFAGGALICWIGVGCFIMRRNDKHLAASRPGMPPSEAIATMVDAGADQAVAQSVIDWIADYYGRPTTPHAADRMMSDIAIDPEDMEDFAEAFFLKNEMPMPTRKQPEMLPDYREVTLTGFAVYLTQRRRELLGKERIEA